MMLVLSVSKCNLRKILKNIGLQTIRKRFLSTDQKEDSPSYFHHIGKEPLVYRSIGQQLARAAKLYGNREAIVSCHEKKRLTFSEVLIEADRLAAGLLKLGLKRGDIIGIWSPNTLQWYLTTMAAARAGLISVGLNPAYQIPEISYCIKKVGIKAIIASESFKTQQYYEMLAKIFPELKGSTKGKLSTPDAKSLSTIIIDSKNDLPGTYRFDELFSLASTEEIENIGLNSESIVPDGPCNLQFTSGSTGQPKAAYLSHLSFVNNGIHIGNRCEYSLQPHRICVQVPFFHVFGIVVAVMSATAYGATLVLPAPSFQPEKSLETIKSEKCTVLTGTPTMYIDLLAKQKLLNIPIDSAILAITGGAPCSPQLFRSIKANLNLKKICTVFGLTETTAAAFFSLPGETEYCTTETVGHLQDHLEAKVINDKGVVVPMGTPGELCIRGYSTMLGYFNDEIKTKETISNDKWLKTGDQFILQKDGYGKIVGRLKDMIIRGGENIFPIEIEEFLATHPDIIENYVFGVPDDRMGEEVCVFMRTTEKGRHLTQTEIKEFCSGKIAHFKIPRYVRVVDDFPKTTSGKIQKFRLREIFVSGGKLA